MAEKPLDLIELGKTIVPIVFIIFKELYQKFAQKGGMTDEEHAMMALLQALIDYLGTVYK